MRLSFFFLLVSFLSFTQEPDTLHFYFNVDEHAEFEISADEQARLESLYNQTRILAIEAHCDFRGSADYNLKLAQRRLLRVEKFITDSGFSTDRSKNVAIGEAQAEKSGYSLKKCRRVDVLFIEPAIKTEEEPVVIPPPPKQEEPIQTGISKVAIEDFVENEAEEILQFDLTILFVNVSTRVLEESKPQMFELLEIMQNNPSLIANFHGHVCCAPNFELAEGRARSVALFLREYGISADRLDFEGHSNAQPKIWPEVTDEDRKQNRRVSVVFTKSE